MAQSYIYKTLKIMHTSKTHKIRVNDINKIWDRIHEQKSILFLYNNNEESKKQIRKTILFSMASRRIKYLDISLT